MIKRTVLTLAALAGPLLLGACANDAQIASYNLSQDADNFRINRRIVFYNSLSDSYLLEIEGLCSQEPRDHKLEVTCKTGPNEYKKHFLGLSDNVTYFSEQLNEAQESTYHYKVTFKPSAIVPSVDVR